MLKRFRPCRRIVWGGDQASSDEIYASGGWDKLGDLAEAARYSAISGYVAHIGARSILDIGCGDGILAERLPPLDAYLGVDLSPVAVGRAEARGLPGVQFVEGDAQSFAPSRRYDVIAFNEVLYYLEHPERAMAALTNSLEPDGAFIVSIFRQPHDWVWQALEPKFDSLDAVTIQHGSGLTWDLRLMRPR